MKKYVLSVLLVLIPCSLNAATEDNKLLAGWNCDADKGEVLSDSSGNGFNGNIHGAKWVKSEEGNALEFNGVSDYVDCGNGKRLGLKDKITFSAWINPKADPEKEAVIVGEVPFRWTATLFKGRVWFYINSGKNICAGTIPFHKWTHITGTFDGCTMKLYINGALVSKRELPEGTVINTGGPLYIGGRWENRYYKGLIKDVRIYAGALPEKEITTLAKSIPSDAREKNMTVNPEERKSATKFFQKHPKPVDFQRMGRQVLLANKKLGIGFLQDKNKLCLTRFYGVETGEDFLSSAHDKAQGKLWELVLRRDKGRNKAAINITSNSNAEVSSELEPDPSGVTLKLKWSGVDLPDEPDAIDVEVTVTLKEGDPLSRWRINVTNRSKTYGLWYVNFPNFSLKPIGGEAEKNVLTVPWGRGVIVQNPFANLQKSDKLAGGVNGNWGEYPAYPRVMQFQSLYNNESGNGLYLALEDGEGYRKFFGFISQPAIGAMQYEAVHCPVNMGFPTEDYRMTYDMCIGPLKGDWYDAARKYRKWALKQKWCSKGPLTSRKDTPRWYKQAPLLLVTATRKGEHMTKISVDRMLAALKFFDTELPLVWYGWKKYDPKMSDYQREGSPWQVPQKRSRPAENVHDGNYPALPAQPNFASACKTISDAGGHVLAYVCASIFDPGLDENAPYAAQAKPNVVINEDGKIQIAEGGKVAWTMCSYTEWWQKRMSETISALIKNELTFGIYFDTFYGGRVTWSPCFSTVHGHSHGGGNDAYLAARKMLLSMRDAMKKADPKAVIAGGEGSAETAIDLLDSILYVQGNFEAGSVPLFAAVYGDYFCRYGRSIRPWKKAGHYIDCASMLTEGAQMGRLTIHEKDPKDYPKEMNFMRKLVRYWKPEVGCKFLGYGQLLHPVTFKQPDAMPMVDYIPTWAGDDVKPFDAPALHTGVFNAADGSLGIFIVNVSEKAIRVDFELTPERYPELKSKGYSLALVSESGKRKELGLQTGKIAFDGEVAGHDSIFLEATPVKK